MEIESSGIILVEKRGREGNTEGSVFNSYLSKQEINRYLNHVNLEKKFSDLI